MDVVRRPVDVISHSTQELTVCQESLDIYQKSHEIEPAVKGSNLKSRRIRLSLNTDVSMANHLLEIKQASDNMK